MVLLPSAAGAGVGEDLRLALAMACSISAVRARPVCVCGGGWLVGVVVEGFVAHGMRRAGRT